MICDDEPDALATFKYALNNLYNVITTSSGQECLAKYSEELQRGNKIDVLLLDYRLGDMNGDEVAYKIKEINGGTKVILITAYELEKKLLAKLKDGKCIIIDIKKPISPMALLVKVAQVLNLEKTNKSIDNSSKTEAMMAAMDSWLGPDATRLVLKTLRLVYKIDEDEIRKRPELFEERLVKILGDRTVRIIVKDASKTLKN
ncbi:MAG: response regulator [Thermoproteota archaeon]